LNNVDHSVEIRFGGIETVNEPEIFDVVLANINRNVLLDIVSNLVHHTKEEGIICLSGLLHTDEDAMRDVLAELPVEVTDLEREEEWILMQIKKVNR
jgi:ribosomal protein L11 methyltransferase